jgi:hypothetical protein
MCSSDISFAAAEKKLRKMNRLDWSRTESGIVIRATVVA